MAADFGVSHQGVADCLASRPTLLERYSLLVVFDTDVGKLLMERSVVRTVNHGHILHRVSIDSLGNALSHRKQATCSDNFSRVCKAAFEALDLMAIYIQKGLNVQRYFNVKHPDKEKILEALALVIQAEKAWRAAWPEGIPGLQTEPDKISEGLQNARESLAHVALKFKLAHYPSLGAVLASST